jgi:DNA-binding XRE family transcriptional regulator
LYKADLAKPSDDVASMTAANERLKQARRRAGYNSATEAAKALSVGASTYLAHENGTRGFARLAARYAISFRVDLKWLLSGTGSPHGNPFDIAVSQLPPDKQKLAIEFVEFLARKMD